MNRRWRVIVACILALGLAGGSALAAEGSGAAGTGPVGRTPPRLSYVDGEVSFWRPGASEWTAAQINTPLAPGDELYTGSPGNLEVQIGSRAFVRAWANTQLGLQDQEPDYLQLKVTAGNASLDLRSLDPAHTIEVATPNAAFTIDHPGYYRLDVTPDHTSFIARRGGRATLIPASGQPASIAPNEQVVVTGTAAPRVETYVAPELDPWDRWNYARTDQLLVAASQRYVSPNVYGVDDLDNYGTWRVVPTYGSVWIPEGVPAGWVPYSTGTWMWDPYYGWTWVDTAPWGWAPYHYGRWVFVNGFWAWAPGPVVVRPAYAPALVAFFGGGAVRVGVHATIGWVALGWGEPLVPWWGPVGFVGVPWWAGWAGPRVVNNVVISRTTVVNVKHITVYRNVGIQNAVVGVPRERFGRGPLHVTRVAHGERERLEPLHGGLRLTPEAASLAPAATRGIRPPDRDLGRPVVATRPAKDPTKWLRPQGLAVSSESTPPPARLVTPPKGRDRSVASTPPPFGASQAERPRPPRFDARAPDRPQAEPPTPSQVPRKQQREDRPRSPTPENVPAPPQAQAPQPPAPAPPQAQAPTGSPSQLPAERQRERRHASPAPVQAPSKPQLTTPAPPTTPQPPAERQRERRLAPPTPQPPVPIPPHAQAPAPPRNGGRAEEARAQPRQLPGEPINRLFPGRSEVRPQGAGAEHAVGASPPERGGERGGNRGGERGGRPSGGPGGRPGPEGK